MRSRPGPRMWRFGCKGKRLAHCPKACPPSRTSTPITWLVVMALRQWNRVQDSLAAHADDTLIIEGHPVVAGDGTHVLLAQNCTSTVQQRAKKQASKPLQAEPPR